jgi:hypothetical protein
VNYLLIEVREREKPEGYSLDAGMLRRAIHKFASETGIDESDMIIRYDQPTTFYGGPTHWDEIRGIMNDFRSVIETKRRRKPWHRRGTERTV